MEVGIEEFLERWVPQMTEDRHSAAVFMLPDTDRVEVRREALAAKLNTRLRKTLLP